MRKFIAAFLLAWLPAACILQTETIEADAGPPGPPGEAGTSPFIIGADGSISYTNGRVGIGTATPSRLLDITDDQDGHARVGFLNKSNSALASEIVEIAAGDDGYDCALQLGKYAPGNTEVAYDPPMSLANFAGVTTNCKTDAGLLIGTGTGPVGAPIVFLTNGTPKARIDAAGNVGIGTSAPSADGFPFVPVLDIAGGRGTLTIRTTEVAGIATLRLVGPDPSFADDWHINMNAGSNSTLRFTPRAGAVNSAFAITNDGRVGIGTTTPAANLEVVAGPGVVVNISDGNPGHALGIYGDSHVTCGTKSCPIAGQSGWMKVRIAMSDKYVPLFD